METNARMIAKALCWQLSGLIVMSLIGYAVTGSLGTGGTLALISTGVGMVAYYLHERAWARVRWGRGPSDVSGR